MRVVAQTTDDLHFVRYSTSTHLHFPNDICYHIFQDPHGYIWAGTDAGLARFDGIHWKTYSQGLASPFVTDIDARNDTLWVATWGGGPHYLEGDTLRPLGQYNHYATSICAGPTLLTTVSMWWKETMMQYRYDGKPFYEYPVCACEQPNTLTYDLECCEARAYSGHLKCKDGSVKAFSPKGIYECKPDATFVPWNTQVRAHALAEGQNNTWWIAWENQIYQVQGQSATPLASYVFPKEQLADNYIVNLHELPGYGIAIETDGPDRKRNTWLMALPEGTLINVARALGSKNNLTFCTVDRDGDLWQGTYGDGIFHIFTPKNKIYAEAAGLSCASVRIIYEDPNEQLWVGTNNGLFVSAKGGRFERIGQEAKGDIENVYQINALPNGHTRVSISTSKGEKYYCFDAQRQPVQELNMVKLSCEQAELWYQDGKYFLKSPFSKDPVPIPLAKDLRLPAILMDNSTLWVATSKGLLGFDARNGAQVYGLPAPYNAWKVQGLDIDGNKNIWIATLYGLLRKSPSGNVTAWAEKDGLLNTCVNAVKVDEMNRIWVGTSGGLQALGPDGQWQYFFKMRNGLADEYVTSLDIGQRRQLYVGSNKGITKIDLDRLPQTTAPPVVGIEWILMNGQAVTKAAMPSAPYRSGVSISVFVPTCHYPELVRYRYRLTEEAPWMETHNREIQLSGLAAGYYQFEVMAKLYDSDWGPARKIAFQIMPPWWQTTWFYLGILLVAMGIAWLLLRNGKQRMERKRQIAELELRALQAQLNPHFVSNVLNGIQYYLLKKDNEAVNDYFARFARLTRSFLDASRLHFIPLRKEIEILRDYIELEKMRFEEKFDYQIDIAENLLLDEEKVPAMLLQPYIENAINHGLVYLENKGELSVSFFRDARGLVCKIEDNGIGRAQAAEIKRRHKGSFQSVGTQITGEMAALLNKAGTSGITITITDKIQTNGTATGTVVEVVFSP